MNALPPIVLCLGLLGAAGVAAQTYRVGVESQPYQPYYSLEAGEYQGYARDLLDAFAADQGHRFIYVALPVKRLQSDFLSGKLDFKYPDHPHWNREQKQGRTVHYSAATAPYRDGVLVLPAYLGLGKARMALQQYEASASALERSRNSYAHAGTEDAEYRLLANVTRQNMIAAMRRRLAELEVLCTMLDDSEWPLEDDDRNRIRAALGYFAVAKDMIPDKIPGIGFLDDALMAELVARELKPELDGYRAFCEYRDNEKSLRGKTKVSRLDWLAAKRRQIWLRIKRRQQDGILRFSY